MELSLAHSKKLRTVNTARAVKLLILHGEEAFSTDTLISALNRMNLLTKDRQTNLLADQVRVWAKFNQVCMDVAISELSDQALLDHFLVRCLVICDIQRSLLWQWAAFAGE